MTKEINLFQLFKDNKEDLSDNSIKQYIKALIKLNDNNNIFYNFDFLLNKKKIFEDIKNYKKSTIRNFMSSICSFLNFYKKIDTKFEDVYNDYFVVMKDLNDELKNNNELSKKEEENWITKEELKSKYDQVYDVIRQIKHWMTLKTYDGKMNKQMYNDLINLVVYSLYYLIPPRRNIDFSEMKVTNNFNKKLDNKFNYFDTTAKKFYFNVYKTAKIYNTQEVDIPDKLYNILMLYLEYSPNKDYLLSNFNGTPFNNGFSINKILERIFKKKIGVSMLRKFYITDKYSDILKDAQDMGSSAGNMSRQYIKYLS